MKPPEKDRRGRKAVPIWIDGIKSVSTTEAKAALSITSHARATAFQNALRGTGRFEGHIVSRAAPAMSRKIHEAVVVPLPIAPDRRRGGALLSMACVHRLGTYGGGGL